MAVAIATIGAAPTAALALGPTAGELARALQTHHHTGEIPEVRRVRCEGIAEEPTEFSCKWQQRAKSGVWVTWSTYVAIDGRFGWILIDEPYSAAKSH